MYNGEVIAVKKLHPLQGLDDKSFESEFRNLRGIHHENVVRLLGYCYALKMKFVTHNGELVRAKEMERVLCFEYMQGGSLDKHISEESCDLDWPTCYRIIKGTCEGLNHLHNARGKPIFHLDLKPANILLDENKTAKIGDLGLSRLITSTETHKTETVTGTQGYMPPEYTKDGFISMKFDVYSLGVIILKIMAGNIGYTRCNELPHEEFVELVTNSWKERLQGRSGSSSQEINILRLKACVDIALRCVRDDRKKRPSINDIVKELEQLESKIKEILLSSDQSKNLIGQQRSSADSNILAVDPTLELRFPFEPRKDISCCLQLTNLTEGSIAFNIKTNPTKYYTEPSKGIMPPCSKRYVLVTLPAQEEVPPSNMQCQDMFLVQSVHVGKELTSDDDITGDLFEKVMKDKVVDVVKLPIVYVARDQFTH